MVKSIVALIFFLFAASLQAAEPGGKYGGAVSYDIAVPNATGVSIPSSPTLQLTTAMTLEAWVYPYAAHTDWRPVITKGSDYWLYASNATADGYCTGSGPVASLGSIPTSVCAPSTLTANQWSHLAVTYDQEAGLLTLFINGVQVAQRTGITSGINVSNSPLQIGADAFGDFFDGRIDDVRIYSIAITRVNGTGDACTDTAPSIVRDMNCPIEAAILITSPSTNHRYITSGSTQSISGTAICPTTIQSVNWTNNQGGSGQATVTTNSWSITNAQLIQNRVNEFSISVICTGAGGSATATIQVRANGTYPVQVVALAMDENTGISVADTSGFGNTASFAGTGNTWVAGQYGSGVNFNGSGYLSIPDSNSLDLSIFTLEMWLRPSVTTGVYRSLISKGHRGKILVI